MGSLSGSFSVVTPNFNMAGYLAETIESVLENLEPLDDYFIIDGGSTDGSVEIIRSYEKYLSGWISEPDRGYADALSKGFARSRGEFQCWINSGDLLLKGTLKEARKRLKDTGADMIFGDDLYIDEQGFVISHSTGNVKSLREMMLYGGWTPLQDACYWRKSLYDLVGGLNTEMKYAADYELFLKMSCFGRCLYVPAIFSAFRRHSEQKSLTGSSLYKTERNSSRLKLMKETGVSLAARLFWNTVYFGAVHWRSRVSCRLHKSSVHRGANVSQLSVLKLDGERC
ncbi:MAG: glycosyltransferase [Firmicutes bacterium]|nr:glycosyltransferase [Bacillota bacterium]